MRRKNLAVLDCSYCNRFCSDPSLEASALKSPQARWLEQMLSARRCRPVVVVILEQRTAVAVPRWASIRKSISNTSTISRQHWALPLPNEGWEMYQPPLYYLIAAASLSACKLSINDSDVDFRSALPRSIFRHCPIRFGFFEFAAPASGASRTRRTLTGGFSADAFVPRALCDERNLAAALATATLYLVFASAEKRRAACVAVCLARIGAWRGDAGESDRAFCCCQS